MIQSKIWHRVVDALVVIKRVFNVMKYFMDYHM